MFEPFSNVIFHEMGQAKKGDDNGIWHRVCLNTIVRKGVKLDSERLKILPMGAKVLVMEQKERRVRISQPIAGWCSLHSSNGDTILSVLQNKSEPGGKKEISTPCIIILFLHFLRYHGGAERYPLVSEKQFLFLDFSSLINCLRN